MTGGLRIVLVIDETPLLHPAFVRDIVEGLAPGDRIVGALRVTRIPASSNIEHYFKRNLHRFRPGELAGLAAQRLAPVILEHLPRQAQSGRDYSVRHVFDRLGIRHVDAKDQLNDGAAVEFVEQMQPDVIVSSNSLIFGPRMLQAARLGAINRHSALLPAYGGILPVFHAVARGERETGVSVHMMTPRIDRGTVLAQWSTPIAAGDTLWTLYARCFGASAQLVHAALDRLRTGDLSGLPARYPPSYFSFPTAEDWRGFRRHGGRFI